MTRKLSNIITHKCKKVSHPRSHHSTEKWQKKFWINFKVNLKQHKKCRSCLLSIGSHNKVGALSQKNLTVGWRLFCWYLYYKPIELPFSFQTLIFLIEFSSHKSKDLPPIYMYEKNLYVKLYPSPRNTLCLEKVHKKETQINPRNQKSFYIHPHAELFPSSVSLFQTNAHTYARKHTYDKK